MMTQLLENASLGDSKGIDTKHMSQYVAASTALGARLAFKHWHSRKLR